MPSIFYSPGKYKLEPANKKQKQVMLYLLPTEARFMFNTYVRLGFVSIELVKEMTSTNVFKFQKLYQNKF